MRILLVQPGDGRGPGLRHLSLVEPLGLEMVAARLDGHEVRLLDLRVEDRLTETLQWFRPNLCGINCSFTLDLYRGLAVADAAKGVSDGAPPFVVIGGHHASLNPVDFHHPSVDAVVLGEGERTLPDLVSCLERGGDARTVPGLALNTAERQIRTGVRPLIDNLDDLPQPMRALTDRYRGRYYLGVDGPAAVVETTRGCPHRCNFCSVWLFYRGRFRAKSPRLVVAEVAKIREPYILFSDDNFLADIDRARHIAALLSERGLRHWYGFQARSDSIAAHPDVIRLWRQIGLVGVFVGLEKIDDAGLSSVNKRNSAINNERAIEVLHCEGVGVTGSFIVDPGWGTAEFAALRNYVASQRIQTPSFTVLTPLPGTVLYRHLRDKIQTEDRELFDLLHAVLPTRLPLDAFYRELAELYRSAYAPRRVLARQIGGVWRELRKGRLPLVHWREIARTGRMLTNAECYLAGHRVAGSPLTLPDQSGSLPLFTKRLYVRKGSKGPP